MDSLHINVGKTDKENTATDPATYEEEQELFPLADEVRRLRLRARTSVHPFALHRRHEIYSELWQAAVYVN